MRKMPKVEANIRFALESSDWEGTRRQMLRDPWRDEEEGGRLEWMLAPV